jgi:trans-aconitate methyltransferase
MTAEWNAPLYQSSHSFVWEYGKELLSLLAPQAGERVLDVGCGTGQLTAEIARSGARILGIDNSPAMIEQARTNFPDLQFEITDVTRISYTAEFDAVFSNAVLHWVRDAQSAAAAISRALKPGGRFVAEFGGKGNIQALTEAAFQALAALGVPEPEKQNPWFFPSIGEYAALLERHGMAVAYAVLFDRPTALEGPRALENWFTMFGAALTSAVPPGQQEEFLRRVEHYGAPRLFRNGTWFADYRRLRVVANKER